MKAAPLILLCTSALAAPAAAGDPIETLLVDSNGAAGDQLGNAVSASGGVLVLGAVDDDVGSNVDEGSATVLRWNGTSWTEEAELTKGDGAAQDSFGSSVSVSGDVIVVGALADDVGSNVDEGSATVFRWDGASWTEEAELTRSDGAAQDFFGASVSVSGDVIAVGAPFDDIGGNGNEGSATVFRWDGASWDEEATLTASDGAAFDEFGSSVSVGDDVVVVGALFDDVGGNVDQGSATVFRWDGASWTEEAELTAGDGTAFDLLGTSVSVSDDVIVAGAPFDDIGGNGNEGSATVFRWDGASWTEEAELTSSDGEAGDQLGFSVSATEGVIVAGALFDDVAGRVDQGSATVFRWNGTSWEEAAVLTASESGALFGFSVSVSADRTVVGRPFHAPGGRTNQGAASLYELNWTDEGCALAGVEGEPRLIGAGPLTADSDNVIELTGGAPLAMAGLFLALSSTPAPFKGGTLKPLPLLIPPLILATDAAGALGVPFVMPAGVPAGTELWAQYGVQDAAAISGVALSNAVLGVTP